MPTITKGFIDGICKNIVVKNATIIFMSNISKRVINRFPTLGFNQYKNNSNGWIVFYNNSANSRCLYICSTGQIALPSSSKNLFRNCEAKVIDFHNNVITNNVKNMKYMFKGCANLTDILGFTPPHLKSREYDHMFQNCKNLNNVPNFPNWQNYR